MAELVYEVRKSTSVPNTPTTPNTVFYVAQPNNSTYVEVYVSNAAGDAVKRVINKDDIETMITASFTKASKYAVVEDISCRNALNDKTTLVYVKNATGDSTVKSGGATYIYDTSATNWVKVSEAESMDLVFSWNNLQDKPKSTINAIDTAVANSHTHSNKTQIDAIGDIGGKLTYNGKYVQTTINDAW